MNWRAPFADGRRLVAATSLVVCVPVLLTAQLTSPNSQPDWIGRSNSNTELLSAVYRESPGSLPHSSCPQNVARPTANQFRGVLDALRQRLADERDPNVALDLRMLIRHAEISIRFDEITRSGSPDERYELALTAYGIDSSPLALSQRAHASFVATQNEMSVLARRLATQRAVPSSDYRDALHALQRDQVAGDAQVNHFRQTLTQIETIIRRQGLATIPDWPVEFSLSGGGSPMFAPPGAEGVAMGLRGHFVLPVSAGDGRVADDFSFRAAAWTLVAHEARPGHALQSEISNLAGPSLARLCFGSTAASAEGWGVYAESMIEPFMPLDAQLASLQWRLLRMARAFIDIDLHAGAVTREDARRVLTTDVALSDAYARSEIDRIVTGPGRAPAYFHGYTRFLELRNTVRQRDGAAFDEKAFHDAVLRLGPIALELVEGTVLQQFAQPPQ